MTPEQMIREAINAPHPIPDLHLSRNEWGVQYISPVLMALDPGPGKRTPEGGKWAITGHCVCPLGLVLAYYQPSSVAKEDRGFAFVDAFASSIVKSGEADPYLTAAELLRVDSRWVEQFTVTFDAGWPPIRGYYIDARDLAMALRREFLGLW